MDWARSKAVVAYRVTFTLVSLVFLASICSGQSSAVQPLKVEALEAQHARYDLVPSLEISDATFAENFARLRADPTLRVSVDDAKPFGPTPSFQVLPASEDSEDSKGEDHGTFGMFVFDGIDVGQTQKQIKRHFLRSARPRDDETSLVDLDEAHGRPAERYHWGGLLAQSLFFNVFENSWRAASDDQIRNLLAHKPFWHDYAASIRQFNMRRWNDGDDFLVNYVGHPMQGAVSGFIEIQNDPVGRRQELSATHEYWGSRFKAFLWAIAYSTHSEISPLGEAGIGNEGGWTYPIHCATHCAEPGTYKKYTNNTGWVDFIITPTVGSLWLLAEDTLDRFVSDPIQRGNRSRILPKIIRGGLNPSRTMANAMRFRAPWYRDFQETPQLDESRGVHFLPSDEEIAESRQRTRLWIAPYFHTMPVGTKGQSCVLCMTNSGGGVGLDYAFARGLSVNFAVERQAGLLVSDSTNVNGSTATLGGGLRFIHESVYNTVSFLVRPGIVIDQFDVPTHPNSARNGYSNQRPSVDHAAVTLMLSNDHRFTRSFALRSSIGDTIVRYRNPATTTEEGVGKPPYLSWLSHDEYTNRSNWVCETGPVFRF